MKNMRCLILLSLALGLFSCKKDDGPTRKEMLVGKNWLMTAAIVDSDNPPSTLNIFDLKPSCTKDDITRFSGNGEVTYDEGPTKCAVADPQTVTGTWTLSADEKVLSITDGAETTSFTIQALTSSRLVVSVQKDVSGVNSTTTFTFGVK